MSISIGALVLVMVASSSQDDKIQTLQKLVHELREDVAELKNQKNETWLNQQRAEEIRSLVLEVLSDADTRASMRGDGVLAGYDGGAYLMSLDENWSIPTPTRIGVYPGYHEFFFILDKHGGTLGGN